MEKELKTSGKMTWGFIWRFIIYYIILTIIFAVIYNILVGNINILVSSIFSVITMAILIYVPSKLATSDIFKDKRLDERNEKKFKRNIIIYYIILMIFISFGNVINYSLIIIGLEESKLEAEDVIKESENMTDEEKTQAIQQQSSYVEEVKKVQKEVYLIVSMIDVILFVFGGILEFKMIKKYQNDIE